MKETTGLAPVVRTVLKEKAPWIGVVIGISLFGGLAGLVQPLFIRDLLVDLVSGETGFVRLVQLALIVLGLQIAGFALHGVNTLVTQRVAFGIQRALRDRTFQQLLDLPIGFFRTTKKGEVLSQVTRDLASLETFLASTIPEAVFRVFWIVLIFSYLVWLVPVLALASLLILPPLWLLVQTMYRRLTPYAERVRRALSEINHFYEENVSGVDLIKAYGQQGPRQERFEASSREFYDQSMRGARLFALFPSLQSSLFAMGTIGLLVLGLHQVEIGAIGRPTLILATLYLGYLFGGFQGVAGIFAHLPEVKVSWGRLSDLYDRETESGRGGASPADLGNSIEFKAVDFSYGRGPAVLTSASLRIEPGEQVALIGASGIGKSTIANLVLGFYQPDGGAVEIGGVDAAGLDLAYLRQHIGYVDQENFLFDASLEDNIRLGRSDASAEDVDRAVTAARLADFVAALPAGLATRVGTRGTRLSMGQRQRVSIARALLKDAPILILDEYTSNIDPTTETEIRAALVDLCRGRTTLIITHRQSTLVDVDRVLRIEGDGRIVESDPADDHLRTKPPAEGAALRLGLDCQTTGG